jgi:hypothetical protein
MPREITVTRAQLYNELWTEPARDVAKRYGISDVGLTKVCRRYRIPKPGVGYWAQREHGKAPEPEPLPPAENVAQETIVFEPGEQSVTFADIPEVGYPLDSGSPYI